jgi:hypothetical protein
MDHQFGSGRPFMTAEVDCGHLRLPCGGRVAGIGRRPQLLPDKGPPLKHLRQKRHRMAAAVQDKHLSTGIIVKFGDNEKP